MLLSPPHRWAKKKKKKNKKRKKGKKRAQGIHYSKKPTVCPNPVVVVVVLIFGDSLLLM